MADSSKYIIKAFGGALTVREMPHLKRAFALEATFYLDRLGNSRGVANSKEEQKPPLHFHPHQEEYVEVLEGRLVVEVEGHEHVLAPGDPELCVRPWLNHRLYHLPAGSEGQSNTIRFLLSGEATRELFRLDMVFFQNWYGYQDELIRGVSKVSIIQVMSMFDAGGSYLSLPWWIPFGRTLARVGGIVIGRWLGGLLGYQPFYRKWTSEWDIACEKMRSSIFQRRFATQP